MTQLKYTAYKTAFNRHIRNARKAAQGYSGWARAEVIADYFRDDTDHPHVTYTFNQMAANRITNRTSDRQFAIDLLNSLADLTARNEEGYRLNGEDRWQLHGLVGCVDLSGVSVYRYTLYDEDKKQLITVEHHGKMIAHATFANFWDYEAWIDKLGDDLSGADLVHAIHKALSGECLESEQQDE